MADYYTEFSFELPLGGQSPRDIARWLNAIHKESRKLEAKDRDQWHERFGGLAYREAASQGGAVWVTGDNPEAAAQFAQEYLAHFKIKGGVFFSWASWCSKPRINEFSGGACVVTAQDILWWNPGGLLNDAAEAGIEILNA